LVVGTQLGILSIFNRRSGYGDCVDRIPGHPHSIDALCNIPSHYPNAQSTVLTGSSDGLVRAVQILPTKLLGVVVDHGEFPIERIAVDRGGEGRWVASAGHEEVLKLTDLKEVFEDEGSEDGDEDEQTHEEEESAASGEDEPKVIGEEDEQEAAEEKSVEDEEKDNEPEAENQDSSADEGEADRKKRKRKKDKDPFRAAKKSKGKNELEADPSFFADL
jgi:WD repeat-containing protein 55